MRGLKRFVRPVGHFRGGVRHTHRIGSIVARAYSTPSYYWLGKDAAPSTKHPRALVQDQNKADGSVPVQPDMSYLLPHPIWSAEEAEAVRYNPRKPEGILDWTAWACVQVMRTAFDTLSGYRFGAMTERKWLLRVTYLETVAGVPGFIGAMCRHLKSLGLLKRERGFIHTLLEEGENERVHLMTALQMYEPGWMMRSFVLITQIVMSNVYFFMYMLSPRFCHNFVSHLEDSAVSTYTHLLEQLDAGELPEWSGDAQAPELAKLYWRLEKGTIREMWAAIRADEAHHKEVNATFADLVVDEGAVNPYRPGE